MTEHLEFCSRPMGSLLHAILGPSCTATSSRPGGSDRRAPEEHRSVFSHSQKDDSLSLFSPPSCSLGLDNHAFYSTPPHRSPLLTAAFSAVMAKRVTVEELLARAESNGYKRS